MYDVSKEFRKFYKNHVVLQSDKQQKLREKKDVNIKRLKDGLALYNQENDTSYAIAETRVQGSMAMATVVQKMYKSFEEAVEHYKNYKKENIAVGGCGHFLGLSK